MVKYRFAPICPHCGEQNLYIKEKDEVINHPELVNELKDCWYCHHKFLAKDVIFPGKEASEVYELTVERMEEPEFFEQWKENQKPRFKTYSTAGFPIFPTKMLMHEVPDVAPRHNVPFQWIWDEMCLDTVYTLRFEYKGQKYEVYAPMSDDRMADYSSEYILLAQRVVDDYLDKIDERGR